MPSAKRIAFNDTNVSLLPLPSSGEHLIRDKDNPHLALRLRATGARTWICLEKVKGRATKRTLGNALLIPATVARLMVEHSADGIQEAKPAEAIFTPEATISDVMPRFLDVGAKVRWKPGTVANMRSAAAHSILPALGQSRIRDVTRQQVAAWYLDVSARTKAARMALSTLSGVMLYAEEHGLRSVGSNPCRGLRRKERSRRGGLLSPSIIQALFRALDALQTQMPDVCDAVRLLLFTGARRSEILGLEWDRIVGYRAVLQDSKTGPRVIWLNALARQILDRRRERRASPFVFPAPRRKGPIQVLDHGWRSICKEAGITSLRVHDIRHHFASLAVSNGVDLRVVGQLLGHRDIDSTLGYAHLASAALLKSASRVSSVIDRAMGGNRVRSNRSAGGHHA